MNAHASFAKTCRMFILGCAAAALAGCATTEESVNNFAITASAGQNITPTLQPQTPDNAAPFDVYVIQMMNQQTGQLEFRTIQLPAGTIRPPQSLTLAEYQQIIAQRAATTAASNNGAQASSALTATTGPRLGEVVSSQVVGRTTTRISSAATSPRPTVAAPSTNTAGAGDQRFGITNLAYNNFVAPGVTFRMGPAGVRDSGKLSCVLTFDDGPHPKLEPQLLDILKTKGVRATFFYLGRLANSNPEMVRRAVAEGHEIGQHSYDHPDMSKLSASEINSQFAKATAALDKAGVQATVFRPPYGAYNEALLSAARNRGMTTLNWTNDSEDWKLRNASRIADNVLENANPGDVILLHSIQPATIEALPEMIDRLRARGCQFTTASEWLRQVAN